MKKILAMRWIKIYNNKGSLTMRHNRLSDNENMHNTIQGVDEILFNGKMKAVTFSYDDGVPQDVRLIEIFDKYNLKATFNLNSEHFGKKGHYDRDGKIIPTDIVLAEEVKDRYKNHEVAAHTLTHPNLTTLDDEEVIRQVETDRRNLSKLVGYDVVGFAYPCGGVNNDDRVAKLIKENTGVKYARTITSTLNFDLQDNIYRFNPTVHSIADMDNWFKLAKEFVELKTETPKIFYIWGHSYELDFKDTWDRMEEFCALISNRDDIFYGTNSEVLLR